MNIEGILTFEIIILKFFTINPQFVNNWRGCRMLFIKEVRG
jgi:hypothetical protein